MVGEYTAKIFCEIIIYYIRHNGNYTSLTNSKLSNTLTNDIYSRQYYPNNISFVNISSKLYLNTYIIYACLIGLVYTLFKSS